jgi:ferric-dicitrate binding protein FerR (iron transport regulator)
MLAATAPPRDRQALPDLTLRQRPPSRLAMRLRSGLLACCAMLCAAADCDPEFRQVNQDGFGIGNNDYAWSMATFGEHLYVGT